MVGRYVEEKPDHTDHADTEDSNEHGHKALSNAAERTAYDLDRDKKDVPDRNIAQNLKSDIDDRFLGREEEQHLTAETIVEEAGTERRKTEKHKDAADALKNAVIFSGTKVLTDKGRYGDTEGAADHPVDCLKLAFCRDRCDGRGSEGIDRRLDHDIRDVVHGALDGTRKPDRNHTAEMRERKL